MASSDSVSSISFVLECSICMEEYNKDKLPRTLPCSHVYCTACLTELARNPAGMIKCPECRGQHNVEVNKLHKCRTTMKLLEMEHTQRKKREAELQKQNSTVRGQAQSASQTSDSDFQGLLTSLKASMWEASQSGKILEKAIKEIYRKRMTILQTTEIAKRRVTDRMDRVIKAATERKQQLLQSLDDSLQESMFLLTDIAEDFKARLKANERFCSKIAEKEEAWRADAQSDLEEIKKLIKEVQDKEYNFHDISIPLKSFSLDTDNDRYQSILTDISSWGGVATEHITHEVPNVHPQNQPNLAVMTQHYLTKTKARRTIRSKGPTCLAQFPNGDIAIGSYSKGYVVFDSDLKIRMDRPDPLLENSSRITGMCMTPTGKLCISFPDFDSVHVVTAEGSLECIFVTGLPHLKARFYPEGLASNKEGEVFVCDSANHVIRVFDQSGQECRRLGGFGEEPGKLNGPCDVAVTPDGNLAVADTHNHRIQVFDGATGRYLATFGSEGRGPNQLNRPTGIAIDSMGFVAVAERGNQRVQLFTPRWESFHIIESPGDILEHPTGISITNSNAIVVCDFGRQKVHIF